jgi:hypothetical protein
LTECRYEELLSRFTHQVLLILNDSSWHQKQPTARAFARFCVPAAIFNLQTSQPREMLSARLLQMAQLGRRAFSTTRQLDARVGFIGLGNMGRHMAANLMKNGHSECCGAKSADLAARQSPAAAAAPAAAWLPAHADSLALHSPASHCTSFFRSCVCV